MLFHLTNALKDEAIKQIKHETGREPKYANDDLVKHYGESGILPFAISFRLGCFDHRGVHTYVITVAEITE